jgi:glutathione peroxidase
VRWCRSAVALSFALLLSGPVLAACPSVLDITLPTLKGKQQNLCEYSGKVVLVVNTASYCGFTSQYKGLEALYRKYREQGLVVLGFPANDFGRQEPGSSEEIAQFCERRFDVSFPMFEKSSVKPGQANPLYENLAQVSGERPQWNFHKYLISRDGTKVASFSSAVDPEDKKLVGEVERLLEQPR